MLMLVTPKKKIYLLHGEISKLGKKCLPIYTKLAVLTASPTSWEIFIYDAIFLLRVGLLFLKYQWRHLRISSFPYDSLLLLRFNPRRDKGQEFLCGDLPWSPVTYRKWIKYLKCVCTPNEHDRNKGSSWSCSHQLSLCKMSSASWRVKKLYPGSNCGSDKQAKITQTHKNVSCRSQGLLKLISGLFTGLFLGFNDLFLSSYIINLCLTACLVVILGNVL